MEQKSDLYLLIQSIKIHIAPTVWHSLNIHQCSKAFYVCQRSIYLLKISKFCPCHIKLLNVRWLRELKLQQFKKAHEITPANYETIFKVLWQACCKSSQRKHLKKKMPCKFSQCKQIKKTQCNFSQHMKIACTKKDPKKWRTRLGFAYCAITITIV